MRRVGHTWVEKYRCPVVVLHVQFVGYSAFAWESVLAVPPAGYGSSLRVPLMRVSCFIRHWGVSHAGGAGSGHPYPTGGTGNVDP